jgi:type IV pilus assembly protein PilX
MKVRHPHSKVDQRGLVLVTSLLLLVVVTILAIGMFRSFGLDERIAGNVREKQRAVNAAETAEQFAESWLSSGNATSAVACTTMVSANVGQVCTSTLQAQGINPASIPWQVAGANVGVNYLPSTPTLMTTSQTGGSGTYYSNPVFYVGFLNTAIVNGVSTTIYQIDAVGYGGSANTAAVVESTYQVQSGTKNLGENQ